MLETLTKTREYCEVCEQGQYSPAVEQRSINSNVRAFKNESFRVWRCPNCQSIHSLDIVDVTPYYKNYPLFNRDYTLRTTLSLNSLFRQLCSAGLKKTSSILDYGCYEGNFIRFLKSKGYNNCHGYNPNSDQFNDLSVLCRTYDFVISNDNFEYEEKPKEYFKKLTDLIAPGGVIAVKAVEATNINLSSQSSEIPHFMHQPYNIHILSGKALQSLAQQSGLSVVSTHNLSYNDTYFPAINWKFASAYLNSFDNTVDVAFEPPRLDVVLRSPKLIFYALFGRFFSKNPIEMILIFRKPSKEIEKFLLLDYVLSISAITALTIVSILAVKFMVTPLSRMVFGNYYVVVNFFSFLFFYGLLSATLIRNLLKFSPLKKGAFNFEDSTFFYWKFITMVLYTSMAFLVPLTPVALRPLRLKLFGAKIGKETAIGGIVDGPYLFTMGDKSTMGFGSVVTTSVTSLDKFILGEVKIGKNVTIGMNAIIMPDVEIGDNVIVEIGSVVMPGSRIPAGERWRGNPARKFM